MSMFKKGLLSITAIAVMTAFVGCGDEGTVVTPGNNNNNNGAVENVATIKPIGGWSDIAEFGTVVFDSTVTTDVVAKVTLTREQGDGTDKWPSAYLVGAASDMSFEGLEGLIVEYTVHSANAEAGTIDGLAMQLSAMTEAGAFQIDREEPTTKKYYGSFTAVLSNGTANVGEMQTDTILTSSDAFYLGYAGNSMADADLCEALDYTVTGEGDAAMVYLKDNPAVLEFTAGLVFGIEHDVTTSADDISFTVHSVKAFGSSDLVVSQ